MAFIAISFGGVLAYLAIAGLRGNATPRWADLLPLLALSLFAHAWKGMLNGSQTAFSVGFIVTLASIPILGTWGAVAVATVATLTNVREVPVFVSIFNCALNGASCLIPAVVYEQMGGAFALGDLTDASYLTRATVPLLAAAVVQLIIQSLMLAAVQRLFDGTSIRATVASSAPSLVVPYLGYGLFGLLLAVLWDGADIGPFAAVLVLAPLYIARWAWAQNEDYQRANERTVAALVRAVEAKDRYTRGHSERVSRASVMIAGPLGLSQQRTRMLGYAGTLHDVGKIAVPTNTLQKSGRLTDDEFEQIALHPVHGFEMVRDIDVLSEAYQGILHHHERLDGRGYPMGLRGDDIPEFARIIAVADAFDAMTSTRSYRDARCVDEAVVELRRCAGSQFEPAFVEALVEALAEHEWVPVTDAVETVRDPSASHYDHDDPSAPLPPLRRRVVPSRPR